MSVVGKFRAGYAYSMKNVDGVYKELGKRIVLARKAKGMSQEQLAAASDIDRSHMGFIEQGRRRPTLATLFKICASLGMSLEKLFKGL
jgi:transcriptional regulator with XRE-family HTH domain